MQIGRRSWRVVLGTLVLVAGCAKGTDEPSQEAGGDVKAAPTSDAKKDVTDADEAGEGAPDSEPAQAGEDGSGSGPEEPDFEPIDGDADTYEMASTAEGIGFRIGGLSKQGWSRSVASGGQLVLSGPPGGPLGFSVRDYPADQRDLALPKVFERLMGEAAAASSPATKVELGGVQRDAQAFRIGESLATTAYCLVNVPADAEDKGGLWVVFYVGLNEGGEPTCEHVLTAKTLAPIAKSFEVVP